MIVLIFRTDLYDVFVNTSTGQISIAPDAKGQLIIIVRQKGNI